MEKNPHVPIKYTDKLKQRAVELMIHAQANPDTAHGAVTRMASELGVSKETLRYLSPQTQRHRPGHPSTIRRPRSGKSQVTYRTRRSQTRQRHPQEGLSFFS